MAIEAVDRNRGFDHLRLRDRVLSLRAMDSLAALDHSALAMIAEHTQPQRFAKDETIYRIGEPIEEVQIVTHGQIRVMRNGQLITDVQRGYGAGFLSVLAGDENGVDAFALEPTCTLALPVPVLLDSFEQNFSLLRNALRLSSRGVLQARGSLPTEAIVEDADPGVYPERSETFVERVIDIRQNGVFAKANVDAAVEFVRRSTEIRGKAGDVVFDIGDHADFWFKVQYGRMRCSNADNRSTTVGAGFILGVMEALASEPRHYRVVAETDYVLYRTELETMLGIIEAHFGLGMDLLSGLSQSLLAASNSEPKGPAPAGEPSSDAGDEVEDDAASVGAR